MPPTSNFTGPERAIIKKHGTTSGDKIHTAAMARLYYAHPNPSSWYYTGLEGAIVFVTDKKGDRQALKMIDLKVSGRVVMGWVG
jgi:hypothetical protein